MLVLILFMEYLTGLVIKRILKELSVIQFLEEEKQQLKIRNMLVYYSELHSTSIQQIILAPLYWVFSLMVLINLMVQ